MIVKVEMSLKSSLRITLLWFLITCSTWLKTVSVRKTHKKGVLGTQLTDTEFVQ